MRSLRTTLVVGIGTAVLLGFFQNCTPAVPYGNTNYFSDLVSSNNFPYEAGFDQLAYLSCSEQDDIYNDGTFFSFRAGAYQSLGLRVSQDFRDSITKVSDEEVVSALGQSEVSSGAQLQLAVRSLDNLQLMYVDQDNGAEGREGLDFAHFFPLMGDPDFSSMLWYMQPGDYIRYWAGAEFIDQYRFEGDLHFMRSQIMENDLRAFLGSRGVIALTFTEPGKIVPLAPGSFPDAGTTTSDPRREVFGMAVQPRFKQPFFTKRMAGTTGSSPTHFSEVNPGSDLPPRVLSSIAEVRIDKRDSLATQSQWICPGAMSFMVVMPNEATAVVPRRNADGSVITDGSGNPVTHTVTRCAVRSDPINPSFELKRLRQSFFAEDWYIDLDRKCIVPKSDHVQAGSCYGVDNDGNSNKVNYDTVDVLGCGLNHDEGVCPHYASLCYRQ